MLLTSNCDSNILTLWVPEQVRKREDINDVRGLSVNEKFGRVDWRFVDVLNNDK